jgi:hypothetical protein
MVVFEMNEPYYPVSILVCVVMIFMRGELLMSLLFFAVYIGTWLATNVLDSPNLVHFVRILFKLVGLVWWEIPWTLWGHCSRDRSVVDSTVYTV